MEPQTQNLFCAPREGPAKTILLYDRIMGEDHLKRCSENIYRLNMELLQLGRADTDEYVKRGTVFVTRPDSIRYRNDNTYIWDGQQLVALISTNLDDYGMSPPSLAVRPEEPINMLSAPTHNNYWWPCSEQREALKAVPPVQVTETVSYRDIQSNGRTFRFMFSDASDLENGVFSLDREWEWEGVYVGAPGEANSSTIVVVNLEPNMILCSVCGALSGDITVCYDEWD